MASRSAGVGSGPSTASPSPIDTTCETTSAPSTARRNCWATVPSATRAAVSRADARSSTGRASSKPYFCMPARSACPGRGRVSGALRARPQRLSGCLVLGRVGSHDLLPLRPLGVADLHRERAAEADAVPDPAEQGDLVLFELHPGTAAVAEAAPGELGGDVRGRHRDPGRQSFEDGDQGGTMRFTCGEPAQHARHPPTPRSVPRPHRTTTGRSATALVRRLPGGVGVVHDPDHVVDVVGDVQQLQVRGRRCCRPRRRSARSSRPARPSTREPKSTTGNLVTFLVCTRVSASNSSSRVPKPPGRQT